MNGDSAKVAAAATDYTCSVVCQLRVPHTPAASQNLCENFHKCGGLPLHIPTVISLRYHPQRQSPSKSPSDNLGPRAQKCINQIRCGLLRGQQQIHQLSRDKQGSWEPTPRAPGGHQQRGASEPLLQQGGPVQPLLICFSSRQSEQGSILRLHRV